MRDLISRQDAIDALQEEINKIIPPFDDVMGAIRCGVRLARNIIEDLPCAEPEIIRCRECKYSHLTYDGDCKECDKWLDDEDFHLTLYLDGDFYCGYAERRTNE